MVALSPGMGYALYMPKPIVYLDNCVYNRPFDDQTQIRISLEKEPFDYTEWQKKHYADVDLHTFNMRAAAFDKNNPAALAESGERGL